MGNRAGTAFGIGTYQIDKYPEVGELWWTINDGRAYPTLIQAIEREPCKGGHQTFYVLRYGVEPARFTKEAIEIGLMQGFFIHDLPDDWIQRE